MRVKLFKENTVDNTKNEFMKFLQEKDEWFGKLLYGVKKGWINAGCTITEILLQEKRPVSLGVLKAYIPCPVRLEEEEFAPTSNQILSLVERFSEHYTTSKSSPILMGESVDFSFQVFGLGIFRCNFSYSNNGTTLSVRYLPYDIPTLDDVGYPNVYKDYLQKMVEKVAIKSPPAVGNFYIQVGSGKCPAMTDESPITSINTSVPRSGGGVILHIGPTGSGKTTAMAAEVNFLAENTAGLILTYEDPIEYTFIGKMSQVSQFELGRDIKQNEDFTLHEVVRRHALRKNPTVIMFGEMRTVEQMKMVFGMGNSGHLVFTSMHGQDVAEAIGMLAGVFKDEPHVLANALKATIAHRLATSMDGKVVPLFEIFIPDDIRTKAISKGDIDEITRTFQEGLGNQSVSWEASIETLIERQKIKLTDKDRIRKMALGNSILM